MESFIAAPKVPSVCIHRCIVTTFIVTTLIILFCTSRTKDENDMEHNIEYNIARNSSVISEVLNPLLSKNVVDEIVVFDRPIFSGPGNARQFAVVQAFKHAWKGYKEHAWGHDYLKPVSGMLYDWFSLGLTIVDSLDTAFIMGLSEEYEKGKEWIKEELIFSKNKDVNFLEVTISVLGALLTNYHFSHDNMFLDKANGPTIVLQPRLPLCNWSFENFPELVVFEDAAAAVSEKIHQLPKKRGLEPIFINPNTGHFLPHATITLGARGDSYYEYLSKQWLHTGKTVN